MIFTDLDGTLLDPLTYRWGPARPALEALKRAGIPLVLCSSKTRSEMEVIREALRNTDPFVVENGGAVFVPPGTFPEVDLPGRHGYQVLEFGLPHARLVEALDTLRRETGVLAKGFSELTVPEVAELTGLPLEAAVLAQRREYDEPFLIPAGTEPGGIERWARAAGLRVTGGGRFFHLTGDHDKGRAVAQLVTWFREWDSMVRTAGLGDSANDLSMLHVVDRAFLVAKPDGTHEPTSRHAEILQVPGVGPVGWNQAVLALLAEG